MNLEASIRKLEWKSDVERPDEALSRLILRHEQSGPGLEAANVGGFHSVPTLQDWPDAPSQSLLAHIIGAGRQLGMRAFQLQAWANVMRKGHYMRAHRHGQSVWSGVYYVRAGDGPGGRIKFASGSHSCALQPRTGLMLIFPGELLHNVEVYLGEDTRISVGFNLF